MKRLSDRAFVQFSYQRKVGTKYEKDILTNSGRKEHIMPVVLDEIGAQGAVGVPSTLGRIDLRDQWGEAGRTGAFGVDIVNTIRNRCVLPLIEKLENQVLL